MSMLTGLEHIVREQEPLAPYTWLRVGGPAQFFAEPTSQQELVELVKRAHQAGMPLRILGGGSNLLVRDEGVKGLVVHLTAAAFANIKHSGRKITAGGGAKLGHVISTAVREGLAGLEMLAGIPGTLGGALHTNVGTHGGDIGQSVASATVLTSTGEILVRKRQDLRFGYRASSLDDLVILEAELELEPGDPSWLTKQMQQQWILKKAGQPLTEQNTVCVFKDAGGRSAASLIEEAELKGERRGDVELCDRNANFVIAGRKAKAAEVLDLINHVKKVVADKSGTDLELAIEIW
ncbi:UDP-N-acetylenolpyruvoylglucosamine reductase MurB [Anatilimnocola aggregata]|uniref:UDP-N-acetylenolpyruvoylglucosamine reductase n=1 Tax=Anatilimnocola aggregata TaxID=2528021 RepID=A0A517YLM4_9BACT|nr:UDP-N-acetylmuramate dehydrogenase [Anatilimnocola aggregata]QDU31124.1 UDP-N-acetylenolpyruvoylglucosamine reductase MurB [Anatilimnocola aggregata]